MKKFCISLLTIVLLAGVSSCIKEKFSAPPATNADPDITPNTTIAAVKALYTNGPVQITQDLIVSAVVVGDDKSGNLYKELMIEDTTAGITLAINGTGLYTNYPVGRRLFILLKNLYVVQYSGSYQLVAIINSDGSFGGLPTTTLSQHVFPGKWNVPVVPIITDMASVSYPNTNLQSELIELDNVEFSAGDRGKPYADNKNLISVSHLLQDCSLDGNVASVYTSGYANFAGALTPGGNGKFVCIYGVYNGATQLTVRDTTDIYLTSPACH